MNTLFDSAGLAIVAYAEVLADGTSPSVNSGIGTAKVANTTGQYAITLPSGKTQGPAVAGQYPRDLIFVQPLGALTGTPASSKVDPTNVANSDGSGTFNVGLYNGSTLADGAFAIVIFRTVLPTPSSGGPT